MVSVGAANLRWHLLVFTSLSSFCLTPLLIYAPVVLLKIPVVLLARPRTFLHMLGLITRRTSAEALATRTLVWIGTPNGPWAIENPHSWSAPCPAPLGWASQ